MRFNTLQYLTPFTLYVVLSTSVAVAIPINGRGVDTLVARSALGDIEFTSSSLYRRMNGTGSTSVRNQSAKPSTNSHIEKARPGASCPVHTPPRHRPSKRETSDADLYSRNGSDSDSEPAEGEMTIGKFDPKHTHKLEKPLTIAGTLISEGSAGKVYTVPGNPNEVIKHLQLRNVPSSQSAGSQSGGSTSTNDGAYKLTDDTLITEVVGLKAVEQYVDYKYILEGGKLKEAWITMKKIPGVSLSRLGFSQKSGGKVHNQDVGFAKEHGFTRNADTSINAARKEWLEELERLVIAKEVHYAKDKKIQNADPNPGNIMLVLEGTKIVSLDIVDWELSDPVPCYDQKVEDGIVAMVKNNLIHFF